MAAVNLVLKDKKASKTRIICIISDGRRYSVRLSTGISVRPNQWSDKQFVKANNKLASTHNDKLDAFKKKVLGIYNEAHEKGIEPDREYYVEAMKPKPQKNSDFWSAWKFFIDTKQHSLRQLSLAKLKSLKGHLEEFEKKIGQYNLDEINSQLFTKMQNWMYTTQKLNTQSTAKYLRLFKTFLNWCIENDYTTNAAYKKFKAIGQKKIPRIIMTSSDIEKIENAELKEKNYLKNVRSLFLLACYTGLRYSDFSRVQAEHLKQNSDGYFIEIIQEKTDDKVEIPLTSESLELVQKLIDGEIHAVSNQKMNTYVKELCQIAEVNDATELITYVGKNKTVETVEKWELVSTHTGRRTFASNLLEKGIPAETVMNFTGHKDYASFANYVNIPKRAEMNAVRRALEGKQAVMKVSS